MLACPRKAGVFSEEESHQCKSQSPSSIPPRFNYRSGSSVAFLHALVGGHTLSRSISGLGSGSQSSFAAAFGGGVECPSSPRVRDGLSAGRLTTYYPYRSLSFLDCPIRLSRKTIFAPRSASSTCLEVCASELRARLKINQPRSSASVAPNRLCLA
jgi:hypothetical protein